jgi:cyclic-di-AMP phosphodiesterase PgpH
MVTERKKPISRKMIADPMIRWLMLAMVTAIFVILLFPSLVVQRHIYQPGDIVERDIKAPQDFFIEDKAATEAIRHQAADQVLTVYDHDPRIVRQLTEKVRNAFAERRQAIEQLEHPKPTDESAGQDPPPNNDLTVAIDNELIAQKPAFEARLGIEISQGAYKVLIAEKFSEAISDRIVKILYAIYSNGVVGNKELLLKENDKGITMRNVVTQTEKTVTALRQYYGPDQARTMVRVVAEPFVKDINYNLVNLIVDICQRLVQPNITLNRNETEERKDQAVRVIKPIMYKFKAGEMLVREGERINADRMLVLQALDSQMENRHVASVALGAALVVAAVILMVYVLYLRNSRVCTQNTNRSMLFLSMVLLMVIVIARMWGFFFPAHEYAAFPMKISTASLVYSVPAATGAMIVCMFMGLEIALPFSMVVSVCLAMLLGNRIEIMVYFLISNAMGAFWVQHCRERKVFITAGLKLGLLNTALAVATNAYVSNFLSLKLLTDGVLAFSSGMLSAIITIGVAPLLEMAFHYTTDITLLELANLDRPILRRLMLEAPGTYHHSVIVGSLVEAAAAEIGANPLLAKVCGYYHDIGKVKKPLYFIENQTNGKNKHDKLAPSMSSLILIAHIKDGIEIARQNKLGQVIIDTIQQHHGTSLISYFFNKAQQLKGPEAVKTDDFRYPGPRPQTIETGLVMLADVVEAASRTLENPTPARIQGLVQHLINKIFSDGQLDNCELTLKDLHSIAKTFNKILNGIHHHRIEYSDTPTKENGKGKHGHPDRQPADKSARKGKSDSEQNPGHLKRLGLP